MSISQSVYNGGAQKITSSTSLHAASPRVTSCYNVGSIDVNLPNPSAIPTRHRGPGWFFITAHGGSVAIKSHTGSTLATLTSGKAAQINLASSFKVIVTDINTAKTFHRGSRPSVVNSSVRRTYDPFCFIGAGCDLAKSLGSTPLDGEDGRDLVAAPFCEDVTLHAKNQAREPVRSADLIMPSVIVLTFAGLIESNFTPDPLHPSALTVLPPEAYDALRNTDKPHGLEYDPALSGNSKVSRHPHHVRWQGTSPSLGWGMGPGVGDLEITRYVWKKIIPYKDYTNGTGNEFNIELRFVAETTVPSGGGTQDPDVGAWGTTFTIYIFCDQLSAGFDDGDSFTPVGGSSMVWTKDDPFAWGLAPGVPSGTQADKFCHPQLLAVGMLPTTLHAPIGKAWIPWEDRKYHKLFQGPYSARGGNRELCYVWSNGAPWTPGTCSDPAPNGVGIIGNIVFGRQIGTTSCAAMTLGGDFPKSKPYEFIVWENGLGVGRTYLQPVKPGWDEECGKLDIAGGSSGSINICVDDKDGIDDGTGRREWPGDKPQPCPGHPDEPFEGVGGSHQCFNTNEAPQPTEATCCYSTTDWASALARDYCVKTVNTYGDFTGSECELLSSKCEQFATFARQAVCDTYDYDMMMSGNQDNRILTWYRPLYDPDWIADTFVYPVNPSDFQDAVGSWNHVPTYIDVASASGSGPIKALVWYVAGTVYTWKDCKVIARAMKATQAAHALSVRGSLNGSNQFTGYIGVVDPTGGTNATVSIIRYSNDSPTVVATVNISNLDNDNVAMQLEAWGTFVEFKWTVSGHSQDSLSVDECGPSEGNGGLATTDASTNVKFDGVRVEDTNQQYVLIEAYASKFGAGVTFPLKLHGVYTFPCIGVETGLDCGSCCDPPKCNCKQTAASAVYTTSASHGGGDDILLPDCPTNGDNPTRYGGGLYRCDCAGDWCPPTGWYCGDCPFPFPSLELGLPGCRPKDWDDSVEPVICKGITYWWHTITSCM